ncbi:glycosyltransferase [Aromatoleum evansii]|uniref:glycosyltransferase n=1 Tax=Aromatoleum evansii TaxID=59406 RepID=UPI00145C555E|nr:glycosyltransferase [Aromatoleum evansii]NMG30299.1 hypothetical protein [Aromatoleum evansii]
MKNLARRRALFFAEAVSLAHVTRPLTLASCLPRDEWDVHFASSNAYSFCLDAATFQRHRIESITPETFLQRLSAGAPLYAATELRSYVENDLELLDQLNPDIVIGDFRLSLAVSARLRKTRYLVLTNAHWSPYSARRAFPLPEHRSAHILGVPLASLMFRLLQPIIFKLHAKPMNQVRAHYGLEPIHDLRNLYTEGDWTLYADTPRLVPTQDLPTYHRYIGPLIWSPAIAKPTWWNDVNASKPTIYVTLGSTGLVSLLPEVLAAMSDVEANLLVATAGRLSLDRFPGNARVADYLPGLDAAARANLVICNGGSASVYQALSVGKPVLGICSNMDQFLTMSYVEAAGAGRMLRAGQANGRTLRNAALTLLHTQAYTSAAKAIAEDFKTFDASIEFQSVINDALEAPQTVHV